MAHGLNPVIKRSSSSLGCSKSEGKTGIGSRRIFAPHFKLQVLDSYRNDADCKGNQRATARKYGIHRRQIQKWLQAENNLRNTVNKGAKPVPETSDRFELALRSGRQRDDLCADACAGGNRDDEGRRRLSPPAAPEQQPMDLRSSLTGRDTPSPSPPLSPDPSAPIDLSLKRPATSEKLAENANAPVPVWCCPYVPLSPPAEWTTDNSSKSDPDVWDLSTKTGTKRPLEEDITPPLFSPESVTSQKPVKLFKPYLHDDCGSSEDSCPKFTELKPPCCSNFNRYSPCDAYCYNFNNNLCTYPSLQPKPNPHYYYQQPPTTATYQSCCEYDLNLNLNLNFNLYGEEQSKQRHMGGCYSVDFKLSAIECYYQDSVCRGDQRAVASKYNVHRRQVQKWLQQEDELLRSRGDVKMMHAVR